jgi:predicted dehydrogenase
VEKGDEGKMKVFPSLSILCVVQEDGSTLQPLLSYLQTINHVRLALESRLPEDLSSYDVGLSAPGGPLGNEEHLEHFVEEGGGWLALVAPSVDSLPEIFGAQPGAPGPCTELRVYFSDAVHPLAERLPSHVYVKGDHRPLEATSGDAEVLLYADWRGQRTPVLVTRRVAEGRVACTTLPGYEQPGIQQILYRLLSHLAAHAPDETDLGVGILGYSPSVGQAHGLGVTSTTGLSLAAICDLDPQRLEQAREDFPGVRTHESAASLGSDEEVRLVVVATPPNSHASLASQMMEAGKHVVCEKPVALNSAEAAAMMELAARRNLHLSCYQNRRWDVDYLAIKQAVAERLLGDLFYVETFVGGFEHPCGLWHSHEATSGGTAYDWGAHYLDWVVSLMPDRPTSVIGTSHKRVWHDTTNADQARVQVRFAGGQEAEFIHSDIAAARKPKWYLLGTEGAIVGRWRDVTTYEIDPVHYFQEHEIPATEMVSDLTLYRRHHSGQVLAQTLALPDRQPHGFYHNLADHLLTGEPIVAPVEESARVVAILEAAARSAAKGGTVEELDG